MIMFTAGAVVVVATIAAPAIIVHNMNSEVKCKMKQIKRTRYIENKSAHGINVMRSACAHMLRNWNHWPSNIDGGRSTKNKR